MITTWFSICFAAALFLWIAYCQTRHRSAGDFYFAILVVLTQAAIYASGSFYVLRSKYSDSQYDTTLVLSFALTFLIFTGLAGRSCRKHWSSRSVAIWCCAFAILTASIPLLCYIPLHLEHRRLLARFPAEDLEPRLRHEAAPLPLSTSKDGLSLRQDQTAPSSPVELAKPKFDAGRLRALERRLTVDDATTGGGQAIFSTRREMTLAALTEAHADFVTDFISRPGFGVNRFSEESVLAREHFVSVPEPARIPQPYARQSNSPQLTAAQESTDSNMTDVAIDGQILSIQALEHLNRESVGAFVPHATLGAILTYGSKRVRGFRPHAFLKAPSDLSLSESSVRWRLVKLELVSLLRHRPAAVYVSQNLPAMDELHTAMTRPLNAFESQSIDELHQGEDIITDRQRNDLLMVGAVRSTSKCTECHSVSRGALLGAFSYHFRRDPQFSRVDPTDR